MRKTYCSKFHMMFWEGMGISFNVKLFLRYYHWRDQVQIIVTIIVAIIRPRINLYIKMLQERWFAKIAWQKHSIAIPVDMCLFITKIVLIQTWQLRMVDANQKPSKNEMCINQSNLSEFIGLHQNFMALLQGTQLQNFH